MHPDRGKSGGFFNKVMHLVRGQPRNSDVALSDSENLSAREVLQESMVRKRRNEAIRRHEFTQLRLLRQRSEEETQQPALLAEKDDGPLSSFLGQETRSHETLQKIDAIEAQMSGQWWRNPAQAAAKTDKPLAHRALNSRQLENLPVFREDSVVVPQKIEVQVPAGIQPDVTPLVQQTPAVQASESVAHSPPAVQSFKPHPDLEEAAILFAHGDVDGARTRLLEQLVQVLSTEPTDEEKAAVLWHAVLDVCRATGDEETFEPLAIDYAEHFGRSAPLWSSMPQRLGISALVGGAQKISHKRQFQWACPSLLTAGGVTALRMAQAEAEQPWSMSWQRLTAMDEAALAPLTKLFQAWADSQGQFVLSDAGKLLQLLDAHTQTGESGNHMQWWALRLALLRLMNRMDAYEDVALNYCLTYEVSPPSWAEPMCLCVVQEEGEADVSILQEASVQSVMATTAQGAVAPEASLAVQRGLYGVLEGDLQALLDALSVQAQSGQVLEVPCDNLIRLDFVAAGSVLNWAADMQSQGYRVRFSKLHHLVAVFFHVIGIHEHATLQATPM